MSSPPPVITHRPIVASASRDHAPDSLPTLSEEDRARLQAIAGETPLPPPDLFAFSSTMILALVARRVRSMENDLARLTQAFEAHTEHADDLSRQLEALQLVQAQAHAAGDADVRLSETVDAAGGRTVEEVLRQAGFSRDTLELNNDGMLSAGTLEGMISAKSSALKRHNTGVEMMMLRIQSLVQQRGEAISLGTNLLEKLGRSDEQILANLT